MKKNTHLKIRLLLICFCLCHLTTNATPLHITAGNPLTINSGTYTYDYILAEDVLTVGPGVTLISNDYISVDNGGAIILSGSSTSSTEISAATTINVLNGRLILKGHATALSTGDISVSGASSGLGCLGSNNTITTGGNLLIE